MMASSASKQSFLSIVYPSKWGGATVCHPSSTFCLYVLFIFFYLTSSLYTPRKCVRLSSVSYQFWNNVMGSTPRLLRGTQAIQCCAKSLTISLCFYFYSKGVKCVFYFVVFRSPLRVSRVASWLFHLHRVRNGSSPLFKPPVTHCIFSPMFVTAWAVFRTRGRIMALLRWNAVCGSQTVWNVCDLDL